MRPQRPAFGTPTSGDVVEPEGDSLRDLRHAGSVPVALGSSAIILRYVALALLAAYGAFRLARPEWWDLLDDVNLAVHEAGHVVFSPFGETITIFGGSLFQVLVPAIFVGYFLRSRQPFAAAIVMGWVSQSLMNVARYIADARARELPLLGGDDSIHDWEHLLEQWSMLKSDLAIAHGVQFFAAVVLIVALGLGVAVVKKR